MLSVNMGKINILNRFAQNKTVFPEVTTCFDKIMMY